MNNRLSDIGNDITSPIPAMPAPPKPKKKAGGARGRVSPPPPPSSDEEPEKDGSDDIIRCVCGATEEDEEDERMMIQCEGCDAWQHTTCMGIAKKNIPKEYFCEVCKPEVHQLLLEQMGRGEKPWERRPGRKPKSRKGVTQAKNQKKEVAPAAIKKDPPPARGQKKEPIPGQLKAPPIAVETKAAPKKGAPKRRKVEVKKDPDPTTDPSLEDKMDVDEPSVATDAPMEQQAPPIEPAEEIDRERTVSMELSPAKEAEILSAQRPGPIVVEAQPDPKVGLVQSPVLPKHEEPPHPQSPLSRTRDSRNKTGTRRDSVASVKRKAGVGGNSDGERKEDAELLVRPHDPRSYVAWANRLTQKTEKKARRGAPVAPPTPAAASDPTPKTAERRRPSVPKPVKKQKQEDFSPQKELVGSVDELRSESRRKVVAHLISSLHEIAAKLISEHDLHLDKDLTAEQLCAKLCLEVEHHVYLIFFKDGELSSEYRKKVASIRYNLRANNLLSTELLRGGVSPERLAHMTSDEMASKELKEFAQQVRWQSEKHHTLITETGPRIRRTHKGEELVGELKEGSANGQETLLSGPVIPRGEPVERSPTPAPLRSPREDTGDPAVAVDQGDLHMHERTTPTDARGADKSRQFSLENVWNHVESPGTGGAHAMGHGQAPARVAADPKIDKDIDMLLGADDGTGTPPYSPAMSDDHYSPAQIPEETVWRGHIEMNGIASLPATAELLGGPNQIGTSKWFELLASVLLVDGRIKHDRATEYLCGQKFSKSSSLVMASLAPADGGWDTEFHKLFDYFKKKDRYAVVGKHSLKCIKDLYIVPIDVNDSLPDWFNVLDPPPAVAQTGRRSKLLVVIFVVIRNHVGLSASATTPVMPESPYPPIQQHHTHLSYASPVTHHPQGQYQETTTYAPQISQQQQQQQPYAYPSAAGSLPQQQSQYGVPYQAPSYSHNGQANVPSSVPSPPPPASDSTALEPTEPLLSMTQDLVRMIPHLPKEQVLAIDKMLRENPDMQTNSEEIGKLVESHLGVYSS